MNNEDRDLIFNQIGYKFSDDETIDEKALQLLRYFKYREKMRKWNADVQKPSKLVISTHSAKCKLTEQIDLDWMSTFIMKRIFKNLFVNDVKNDFVKGMIKGNLHIGEFEKKNKKIYYGRVTLISHFMGFILEISIMKHTLMFSQNLPENAYLYIKQYLEKRLHIELIDPTEKRKTYIDRNSGKKVDYSILECSYKQKEEGGWGEDDWSLVKKVAKGIFANIFKQKNEACIIRGLLYNKYRIGVFEKVGTKQFDNQCTLLLYNERGGNVINIKFFSKKSVSLTGSKQEKNGKKSVNMLLDLVRNKYNNIGLTKYTITMINTSYYLGFRINRVNVCLVLKNQYNLCVSFDPDSYSGINTSFMYLNGGDGVCRCDGKRCKGKGNGKTKCKKITVIIFQKGNILITGASDISQTNYVYEEINRILTKHYEEIVEFSINDLT